MILAWRVKPYQPIETVNPVDIGYIPFMGNWLLVFCIWQSYYSHTAWRKSIFIEIFGFCKRIKPNITCNPNLIFRLWEHLANLPLYYGPALTSFRGNVPPWPYILACPSSHNMIMVVKAQKLTQGVQPWALKKFPDFSLTILWFSLTMRHIIGISLLP